MHAIDDDPETRIAHRQWQRAQHYLAEGQHAATRAMLEALLVRVPDDVQARLLLASVLLAQRHLRESCAQLCAAVKVLPDDADVIATTAYCLYRVGETLAMRDCLAHPAIARLRSGPALARLGSMQQLLGQHLQALALMDRATEAGFDVPEFRYHHSLQLQFNGRVEEAERELSSCLRSGGVGGRAAVALARMRRQTTESNHLDYITGRLKIVEHGSDDEAAFEFARFEELDDLDRREEAWAALRHGNAIMYSRAGHDIEQERRHFAGVKRTCSKDFVATPAPAQPGPQPIFIIGMPRSGTTLLERIVSNHSQVASCGELPDFMRQLRWVADHPGREFVDDGLLERAVKLDYAEVGRRYLEQTQWRAGEKPFFIDKFPANFMLAGFIHRALPQARILHMVRPAMDLCFSNWKAIFGQDGYNYSYDLRALADHYRQYRALMDHWRDVMPTAVLDVSYEALVRNPEEVAARIFEFCGLPFEAGCGDTSSNRAPASSLSAVQARGSIHLHASGGWQRYADHLRTLRAMLDGATPS